MIGPFPHAVDELEQVAGLVRGGDGLPAVSGHVNPHLVHGDVDGIVFARRRVGEAQSQRSRPGLGADRTRSSASAAGRESQNGSQNADPYPGIEPLHDATPCIDMASGRTSLVGKMTYQ